MTAAPAPWRRRSLRTRRHCTVNQRSRDNDSMVSMTRLATWVLFAAVVAMTLGPVSLRPHTFAPRHGLGPGVMAITAYHDVDRRPAGADMADYVTQHHRHLSAIRRLARAQDDRHRLAGSRFINVD